MKPKILNVLLAGIAVQNHETDLEREKSVMEVWGRKGDPVGVKNLVLGPELAEVCDVPQKTGDAEISVRGADPSWAAETVIEFVDRLGREFGIVGWKSPLAQAPRGDIFTLAPDRLRIPSCCLIEFLQHARGGIPVVWSGGSKRTTIHFTELTQGGDRNAPSVILDFDVRQLEGTCIARRFPDEPPNHWDDSEGIGEGGGEVGGRRRPSF